jgi:hypothetical protein
MDPDDDYYDAKVTVLSEMIKHHVKEEEQPGGMFANAKKSELDLNALGEQMLTRKTELESNEEMLQSEMPPPAARERSSRSRGRNV